MSVEGIMFAALGALFAILQSVVIWRFQKFVTEAETTRDEFREFRATALKDFEFIKERLNGALASHALKIDDARERLTKLETSVEIWTSTPNNGDR
jgi:hypothetical protein